MSLLAINHDDVKNIIVEFEKKKAYCNKHCYRLRIKLVLGSQFLSLKTYILFLFYQYF